MMRGVYAALALLIATSTQAGGAPVDPYHGDCTPEAALDVPQTWMDAKGPRVLPTCVYHLDDWDTDVFETAKGAPLTQEEHAVLFYRWVRLHDPDRILFGIKSCSTHCYDAPIEQPDQPVAPAPVPTPASLALMLVALGMFGAAKFWF